MSEKLTRSELSWLLTQEARGAAERLRKGVQILTKAPPPPPQKTPSERPMTLSSTGEEGEGLESSLDMLDSAMSKLGAIYGAQSSRGRGRGRVDIAAILWEVVPDARVNLAPGAGTEVSGDESELRRMLHVFLGASAGVVGGAQVVDLKREGEEVRLSVALGPDTAPVSPAERGWLSRMAIRYGGRYELDGATQILIFPAEDAEQAAEVKELRKELEAAKAQGEAYARELAAVFTDPVLSSRPPPLSEMPPSADAHGFLAPLARIADSIADDLRAILGPLGAAKIKQSKGKEGEPSDEQALLLKEVHESLLRGAELLALTRQIARVGGDISELPVDVAAIVREEGQAAQVAFASRGVVLSIDVATDASFVANARPAALRALVAEMLDRALRSCEPGSEVRIAIDGVTLVVEGVGDSDCVRSLREGGRAAIVFLTEIARAHDVDLHVEDSRISARFPSERTVETLR